METERYIFWGVSLQRPSLCVIKPFDGEPATIGNGNMVARVAARLIAGLRRRRRWAAATKVRRVIAAAVSTPAISVTPKAQAQRVLHRLSDRYGRRQDHALLEDVRLTRDCKAIAAAGLRCLELLMKNTNTLRGGLARSSAATCGSSLISAPAAQLRACLVH